MYFDSTKITLMLDYCVDRNKTEPDYICTRIGAYSIQQLFDQLALAPNISLPKGDRGSYANMYGVYTDTTGGALAFSTYSGNQTRLKQMSSEMTNMNSATTNGLIIVQYAKNLAIIYNNNGTPIEPQLVPILTLSLPAQPYACLATPEKIYISSIVSNTILTIYDLSSGTLSYINQRNTTYRPVMSQWQNTILMVDQYQAKIYDLNGAYQRNWPYFSGPQSSRQHYVHYDYAGRVFTCNSGGSHPGVYAFLSDGSQIAHGPTAGNRSIQFYVTKEQVAFVNILDSGPGMMKIIGFS